jgi:hypothetical protein
MKGENVSYYQCADTTRTLTAGVNCEQDTKWKEKQCSPKSLAANVQNLNEQ